MNNFSDDIDFSNTSTDTKEKTFYSIIGHIEDILMDDNFLKIYNDFMERHWNKFDNNEENKLFYIDIFKEYQETVEKYIEGELVKRIEGFDMCMLEEEIRERQGDLDGEIFELLASFTDFLEFKTKLLDYRDMKEGKTGNLSDYFLVTKYILQPVQHVLKETSTSST